VEAHPFRNVSQKNNLGIQHLTWASYRSIISIVFDFEFGAALVAAAQRELRHFQAHKAFDHSIC
jgi:hypothetical protein